MKKIISIILLVVIMLNLALFSFRVINRSLFWLVIILIAVYAYFLMPKMKK